VSGGGSYDTRGGTPRHDPQADHDPPEVETNWSCLACGTEVKLTTWVSKLFCPNRECGAEMMSEDA